MDTKIAAALNNLNLNSQQKKIINEVLDNKFKYIDANTVNINSTYTEVDDTYNDEYYEFTYTNGICLNGDNDKGLSINSNYFEKDKYYVDNELEEYFVNEYSTFIFRLGQMCIDYNYSDSDDYVNKSKYILSANYTNINLEERLKNEYSKTFYNNIGVSSKSFSINTMFTYIDYLDYKNNKNYTYYLADYLNFKTIINNLGTTNFLIKYNEFNYSFNTSISSESSNLIVNSTNSKGLYYSGANVSEPYQLGYNFTKDQIVAFGANSSFGILKGTGITFTMAFDDNIFIINYNHANDKMYINTNIYAKDFVIEDESNAISVKDTIQDIYNKINNIGGDNGSDIIQSFIDKEIEELIYKTAEIRSKDTEYNIGEEFKELVISEKEYNKYNYTWEDNSVHNYLHEQYDKIVVYKDILIKTINITNSNGEQEEINVLIVE